MKPDHSPNVDMDAAIDRAVRSIMNAEPPAGLRQRVLSRINETPRRGFPILRVAIVGGSLAVVALAVAIRVANLSDVREEVVTTPPPVTSGPRPGAAEPGPPPPIAATPRSIPHTAQTPRSRVPYAPTQSIPRGLVVAQNLVSSEDEIRAIDPAATALDAPQDLDPLQMPALDVIQRIDLSSATVPPVTMAPIAVSKLPEIAPLPSPIR
jgi:hypothetical protein